MARPIKYTNYYRLPVNIQRTILTRSWIQYAVSKTNPIYSKTKKINWSCFNCKAPINVKYNTNNKKHFFCPNCTDIKVNDNLILKYMLSFKAEIRGRILGNTSLELKDILSDESNTINR